MLNNDTLDGGESQSRWTHSIAQSIVQAARRPDPASDLHEQLPGGRAPDRMETGTHTQVHTTSGCTGGAAGEAPAMGGGGGGGGGGGAGDGVCAMDVAAEAVTEMAAMAVAKGSAAEAAKMTVVAAVASAELSLDVCEGAAQAVEMSPGGRMVEVVAEMDTTEPSRATSSSVVNRETADADEVGSAQTAPRAQQKSVEC